MKSLPKFMFAAVAAAAGGAVHSQHHAPGGSHPSAASPYAGQERREIKSLSAEEQRAWLEGQGSGLARAAELNRFPGPMHVLEHARELGLSPVQVSQSRELMDRHKAEVRAMGQHLVALERELDRLFTRGAPVDASEVSRLAESIGLLAGRIRASHLRTHVQQTALLTPQQVDRYQQMRGYAQ